jgi:hypothetical protein
MKVTYLFGAGASRNALPIVSEIPDRILAIVEKIRDTDNKLLTASPFNNERLPINKVQALTYLIEDLTWLAEAAKNHASIDTFAKKLYLKQNTKELKRLKVVLSIYFILEQSTGSYDKRYDAFFASVLEESISEFPSNIRIISWNYDYQFEKAFSEYTESTDIIDNQRKLNVCSKFTYRKQQSGRFGIFKINGTTNFIDPNWKNEHEYCDQFDNCINLNLLEKVLENYVSILHTDLKLYCNLSFAWERPSSTFPDIVEYAISEINDTEILIVIGYSFPFFNRSVDRKIINGMKKLQKVYFQSPDADNLKERFLSISDKVDSRNMILRFDVDQFLLPAEL